MRASLVTLAGLVALSGCAGNGSATPGGKLRVVAAESFWGSIAAQLGGRRTDVRSIVADPALDPHSYQPTPSDARAIAASQLTVFTGIGYDPWVSKSLAASPSTARVALNVSDLLALHQGDNPHQWYSPASVRRVIDALVGDLRRLDPAGASYYLARALEFENRALGRFNVLVRQIRARFAGTPVGASESIFAPLAGSLGLDLITPPGFMKAVTEGTDVSGPDKSAADQQIARRRIAVWVLNTQNETPDVARLTASARDAGIPIVEVTETLPARGATFQDWQAAQLQRLLAALSKATRR